MYFSCRIHTVVVFETAEWKWRGISIHNPTDFDILGEIEEKSKSHIVILTEDGGLFLFYLMVSEVCNARRCKDIP
jgi:hypothetical protein